MERMPKRAWMTVGAALLAGFAASPAGATAGMDCTALDGSNASASINLPRLSFWATPNWVQVSAGEAQWSTVEMDGFRPAALAQSFNDDQVFAIDLSDDQAMEIVARIRVLQADEGEELAFFGYVQIPGQSVHPITCGFTE
jgi:hypothetical protein